MATLETLEPVSISRLDEDSALKLMYGIRESRRTDKRPTKKSSETKKTVKAKNILKNLTSDMAKQILKLLEESGELTKN